MFTPKSPSQPPAKDSLSVELGGWFKANATGMGVFVIGVILILMGLLTLVEFWLSAPVRP